MSESSRAEITIRPYDHKKDARVMLEVFKEVGWMERAGDRQTDAAMLAYLKTARSWVADLGGRAESLICTGSGEFRYLDESLTLCAITAAVTSTIARRLNCATRATAEAVADAAEEGFQLAGLGVFEQGFYERLGFGIGTYEHWLEFDPAALKVGGPARPAHRLTKKDWKAVHTCLLNRMRGHGSCNVFHPELIRFEMAYDPKSFGMGFYDQGELTHHLWLSNQGGENGPLLVYWSAFRTYPQLRELLSLLKSIGDQFHLVKMREPPGVQLQELIEQPFKYQRMTRHSRYECRNMAAAYWQMRMLDLKGCIEKTRLPVGTPLRFNLELSDPIAEFLPEGRNWMGVGGNYTVNIGERSMIEAGKDDSLPILRAQIGAFTRMWMGALRASALTLTEAMAGPPELIRSLDRVFQMSQPHTDWDF
ncbi:MAG: sterol carrier protein domain-containing protein [Spirochaetaceae bacterium]|nr:MAG: sterol carrier protein domain-containing protein [Spirochaetaceae bacterium]